MGRWVASWRPHRKAFNRHSPDGRRSGASILNASLRRSNWLTAALVAYLGEYGHPLGTPDSLGRSAEE